MTATAGIRWHRLKQASAIVTVELAARAEGMALAGQPRSGDYSAEQRQLQVKLGSLQQARYDARIDQLRQLPQNDSGPIKKCKETTCLTR